MSKKRLFELVLYQSCNYKCKDCPMEKWLYKPDELMEDGRRCNGITNELLLKWLDTYLEPKEWFIEITGGEPSLYPYIDELLAALNERGYKGVIRTNGTNRLPSYSSFKRVVAWHSPIDDPSSPIKQTPIRYDYVLILENPDDDWQAKEKYCKKNDIPYVVFPYKHFSTDQSQTTHYQPRPNSIFKLITTMFASGAIGTGCFTSEDSGKSLQNMDEPIISPLCEMCGNVEALEYFIFNAPGFKEAFEVDEKELVPAGTGYITYPILNSKSEWVNKDGEVVALLGEDINGIPKEYVALGNTQKEET
jgi:organic radical activating enzyme